MYYVYIISFIIITDCTISCDLYTISGVFPKSEVPKLRAKTSCVFTKPAGGRCRDDYFGDSVYAVCIGLGTFGRHYSIYNKHRNKCRNYN